MVTRTQLSLDPELHRRARARAAELGISLAEYLRRLVADDLRTPRRSADPSSIFDLGESCGSDIAPDKNEYVDEAVRGYRRSG